MAGETFTAIPVRENGLDIEAGWFNALRLAGITIANAVLGAVFIEETSFTVANNQVAAANVTGLVFSGATVRSAVVDYYVYRNTTGGGATELAEAGKMVLAYKTVAASWELALGPSVGDAGMLFSVTAVGQVQYTSTNITGTAATSKMKFKATSMAV